MTFGVLARSATRIPMEWVRPFAGVNLIVPYYHMVSDGHVPHVSPLYRFRSIAEFTADVEFFASRFEPVTLQDIVDALNGARTLPPSCVHLTFDDGFREMYEVVAPILRRAGVPATFFITTSFLDGGGMANHNVLSVLLDRIGSDDSGSRAARLRVESILPDSNTSGATLRDRVLSIKYGQQSLLDSLVEAAGCDIGEYVRQVRPHLSSEQVIALLRQGFSIGSHSCDHPLYADLALTDQMEQTRTSMQLLEARFGVTPRSFAFPHTDSGVASEFFNAVFSDRLLDVSFGTSGLVAHFHRRNIERVGMEKTSMAASQILARHFARAAYKRFRSGTRAEVVALPTVANGSR